jgi:hypothetical protein
MAKENKPAEKYAANGTSVAAAKKAISTKQDPNKLVADQITPKTVAGRVSAGNPDRDDVKTSGIKIRGTGAATKGLKARGPMA